MILKIFKQVICLVLILSTFTFSQSTDSLLSVDHLVETMLAENAMLKSYGNFAEASKQKIAQAGTLPDPKLTAGLLNLPTDSYVFDQEPMTQKMIGLNQSFPFFGKLGLKEDIAAKDYEINLKSYRNTELELIRNLESLYYKLFLNQKSISIMQKNKSLLSDFVKIATTKYSAGQGIQQDVLKSQVELLKIDKKLIELKQQKASIKSQINVLLNRTPQEFLGETKELQALSLKIRLDSLQVLALNNNPNLYGKKLMIDKSDLKYNLAKKEYWPDFGVTVNYGQRENRSDFLSGLVSINIPLYAGSKQSKMVQETALNKMAAKYAYSDAINQIRKNVKIIYDEIQKNKELLSLYQNGILPQAWQSLESAVAAYRTDKVDFITLLNNQLTLLTHELDYYKILMDYNTAISDLAFTCGVKQTELTTM